MLFHEIGTFSIGQRFLKFYCKKLIFDLNYKLDLTI